MQDRGTASKESHIPPKGGWPFSYFEQMLFKGNKKIDKYPR